MEKSDFIATKVLCRTSSQLITLLKNGFGIIKCVRFINDIYEVRILETLFVVAPTGCESLCWAFVFKFCS